VPNVVEIRDGWKLCIVAGRVVVRTDILSILERVFKVRSDFPNALYNSSMSWDFISF
jgi:hypothetical protein